MKIEINTTPRSIERINMILKQALDQIEVRDDLREAFSINDRDLKSIESFRNKMIDSYFNQRDLKRDSK